MLFFIFLIRKLLIFFLLVLMLRFCVILWNVLKFLTCFCDCNKFVSLYGSEVVIVGLLCVGCLKFVNIVESMIFCFLFVFGFCVWVENKGVMVWDVLRRRNEFSFIEVNTYFDRLLLIKGVFDVGFIFCIVNKSLYVVVSYKFFIFVWGINWRVLWRCVIKLSNCSRLF